MQCYNCFYFTGETRALKRLSSDYLAGVFTRFSLISQSRGFLTYPLYFDVIGVFYGLSGYGIETEGFSLVLIRCTGVLGDVCRVVKMSASSSSR